MSCSRYLNHPNDGRINTHTTKCRLVCVALRISGHLVYVFVCVCYLTKAKRERYDQRFHSGCEDTSQFHLVSFIIYFFPIDKRYISQMKMHSDCVRAIGWWWIVSRAFLHLISWKPAAAASVCRWFGGAPIGRLVTPSVDLRFEWLIWPIAWKDLTFY